MKYLFLGTVAIVFAAQAAAAEPASLDCSTRAPYRLQSTLPVTASAIRRSEHLTIVAIGSSSTAGAGASAGGRTYPAQLARELRRRWPGVTLTVLNKGVGGEVASQMVARFERDVLAHSPDLVIWQTGTNSLLRDGSTEGFAKTLRTGIRVLKQAQADIVLMDPQYAPKVLSAGAYPQLIAAIGAAAKEQDIGLFARFAVMQSWIESGRFEMSEIVSPDRLHMNDTSYACVARLLAAAIAYAVQSTPIPMAETGRASAPSR